MSTEKKVIGTLVVLMILLIGIIGFSSCAGPNQATVASKNLATAAEQFQLARKVFFYNGITGEYIYTMEGLCSIEDQAIQVEVTCKVGVDENGNALFLKNLQGLSDNITYTVIQLSPEPVSSYRYKVMVRPETVLPDFEVDLSTTPEESKPKKSRE